MTTPVLEKKKVTDKKLKPPRKYKVILCNDDVTSMEFVIGLLMTVFRHSQESAVDVMMKVHQEGSGVAGIYTFEVAEQKCLDATNMARSHGFPLVTKMEEE
jgi:ATP-dependent Clp protease adaptor protein ClpS